MKLQLIPITNNETVSYEGNVYDLEVENDHTFNIEGIVVHNSVCTTRLQTGFHTPMFSTLLEVCKSSPLPVIADGGIRHNGDIVKALVAGATMVMAGSIFANCSDSPAPINKHGKKEYWGSASFAQKGERNHVEGTKIEMELNPLTLVEKLKEIKQSLQSAISYAGGSDLSAFNSVKWTAATASN